MKNIKINIYTSYIAKFVTMLSSFYISILLINGLSKFEFGQYSIIVSFITFIGMFSALGLEPVMTRYLTEFIAKKKFFAANRFILILVLIRLLILIFISIILFTFYDYFLIYYSIEISIFSFIMVLFILILRRLYTLMGTSIVQAYLEVYLDSYFKIVYGILRIIFFYQAVHLEGGLKNIIIAWVLLELISFIYFMIICMIKIRENKLYLDYSTIDLDEQKRIFNFAKFNILSSGFFMFANISMDIILIGYFMKPEDVAMYTFATSLVLIIAGLNPVVILKGVLTAYITNIYVVSKDTKLLLKSYNIITKISIIFLVPIYAILLINIDKIIIYIYNKEYLSTIPLINYAVIFFFISGLTRTFTPLIEATEKNKLAFLAGFFSIYNLILNILLIPSFGIYGALFATGSAGIMVFLFYLYHYKVYFNTLSFFPFETIYKTFFIAFLLVLIVSLLKTYITSIYLLILEMLIFILIYIYLSYIFKVFSNKEVIIIKNLLKKET